MKKYYIIRFCNSCGKDFKVILDKNGRILNKVLYGGKMTFDIGMWAYSGYNPEARIWKKIQPWWKEFYYRFKDAIKLLLHLYKEIEYWECEECLREVENKYV